MPESPDPLNEAITQATLATLLGSTRVPYTYQGPDGVMQFGTITVEAAFAARLRSQAFEGKLDDILRLALSRVDVARVTEAFEGMLAKEMLKQLQETKARYGGGYERNWIQDQIKGIAVDAAKAALAEDDELMDNLRTRIGAQVDRNKVAISVQLTDPEGS